MSWRQLIQNDSSTKIISLPFLGKREIYNGERTYTIKGTLPRESGWYACEVDGSKFATVKTQLEDVEFDAVGNQYEFTPDPKWERRLGYVVHDELFTAVGKHKLQFSNQYRLFTPVQGYLLPDNTVLCMGPSYTNEHLADVAYEAYLGRANTISRLRDMPPTLVTAYETAHTYRLKKEEQDRILREKIEQERRIRAAREASGTTYGRRQITEVRFDLAAKSAIEFGGGTFLDHREGSSTNEMIVTFEVAGQRIDCLCDRLSLQIIDSGVCLTDESTGISYDNTLSLETLPHVIKQAHEERRLVVWSGRANRW